MTSGDDPNQGRHTGTPPAGTGDVPKTAKSSAEIVHEARKAIKRMRALARLLRYELGEQEFERVNGSLRATGQRLSGARDAEVRIATLECLRSKHPKALAHEGIERLWERLEREREQADEPTDTHEVLADIAGMRNHLARWSLAAPDFDVLAPGLRRIYRQGRQRHRRVRRERGRDPEHLHDWRKRVKALYYALDMLGGAGAKQARRATRRADRLGDLLGEEHDLWMLAIYVEQHPHALGDDEDAERALSKQIRRRRQRLRKRALRAGARLYKRKPGAFTRRMESALTR
ncbi:MAG: CHAD domain-containing protein [Solirubrobacteraceae bacterium]